MHKWAARIGLVTMLVSGAIVASTVNSGRIGGRAVTAFPAPQPASSGYPKQVGPVRLVGAESPAPSVQSDLSAPSRLRVAAVGIDTALQPLRLLADGSLPAPSEWQTAGWYASGVIPGQAGPAIIAGHVDSVSGPAVFFRLRELHPGDQATVRQQDGHLLRFVVDTVDRYSKDRFPTQAVYGLTPQPTLRLITCTGDFDSRAGSYLDNLVVSAHLVP
jgi:hypothetical protein